MPLIALIVLIWQRRRVGSLLRRARDAWASRPASEAAEGRSARAARAAGWVGASAWQAVDTPRNAARVEQLLARARAAAARTKAAGRGPATV